MKAHNVSLQLAQRYVIGVTTKNAKKNREEQIKCLNHDSLAQ